MVDIDMMPMWFERTVRGVVEPCWLRLNIGDQGKAVRDQKGGPNILLSVDIMQCTPCVCFWQRC